MFKKLFANNGVARGWLYFQIAAFSTWLADATVWLGWLWNNADTLRGRTLDVVDYVLIGLLIFKTAIASIVAGYVAVRAYLDQHLSNAKANAPKPNP